MIPEKVICSFILFNYLTNKFPSKTLKSLMISIIWFEKMEKVIFSLYVDQSIRCTVWTHIYQVWAIWEPRGLLKFWQSTNLNPFWDTFKRWYSGHQLFLHTKLSFLTWHSKLRKEASTDSRLTQHCNPPCFGVKGICYHKRAQPTSKHVFS